MDLRTAIEQVVVEDEEKINQYKSTFLPNKKIAAISTGVASYMTRIMEEQEKAKK